MKNLRYTLQYLLAGIALAVLFAAAMPIALAADPPAAGNRLPERDKMCTVCHNESWEKPILSIYQTRHGVTVDARTPA